MPAEADLDVRTCSEKMAGRDEAATAVSTRTGKYEDALIPGVAAEQEPGDEGEIATRILRHAHERDPELLDHQPVDLAHLRNRKPRDGGGCDPRGRARATSFYAGPAHERRSPTHDLGVRGEGGDGEPEREVVDDQLSGVGGADERRADVAPVRDHP